MSKLKTYSAVGQAKCFIAGQGEVCGLCGMRLQSQRLTALAV